MTDQTQTISLLVISGCILVIPIKDLIDRIRAKRDLRAILRNWCDVNDLRRAVERRQLPDNLHAILWSTRRGQISMDALLQRSAGGRKRYLESVLSRE